MWKGYFSSWKIYHLILLYICSKSVWEYQNWCTCFLRTVPTCFLPDLLDIINNNMKLKIQSILNIEFNDLQWNNGINISIYPNWWTWNQICQKLEFTDISINSILLLWCEIHFSYILKNSVDVEIHHTLLAA